MTGAAPGPAEFHRAAVAAAALFLEGSGYRVLDEGWECPEGRIDIIAERSGALAAVSVLERRAGEAARGRESAPRLAGAAEAWAAASGAAGAEFRFEEVSVTEVPGGGAILRHRRSDGPPCPARAPRGDRGGACR